MPFFFAQVESLFATPAFAAVGAAAVSVPIVIHLLSRARRKREVWGAMRWLMEAYRKQQKRAKLEHLLLLLLRCLAVLVLGLALAGPQVAGSLRAMFGGAGGTGRETVIVVNNAITSSVRDAEGEARLERFRESLAPLLADAAPDDRFTLITSARPARTRLDAVRGAASVREALEALEPVAARPDLADALELTARRLEASDVPAGRARVLLLDDWATGDERSRDELPQSLADLGERAEVRVLRPAPSTPNVQITAVEPRRSTFVPSRSDAVMPVRVSLRRFVDTQPASVEVMLGLSAPGDDAVIEQMRDAEFASGQREVTLGFDLEMPGEEQLRQRQHWMLRTTLDAAAGNAVPSDDARLRWVTIKPTFNVALVGGETASVEGEWSPARWLTVGLTPQRGGGGAFTVQQVRPVSFDLETLDQLDAVFVLSPDRLPPAAWTELGEAVREGLALWVWPPTGGHDDDAAAQTAWFEALAGVLQVDWTLGAEPNVLGEAGLRLDDSREAPAALSLLGADWSDLLRPVRVFQRWPIDGFTNEEVWLTASDGQPLLLARGLGRGGVLLSTAAPDTNWTNLPAKPLLVPLLHEAVRAVVGGDPLAERTPRQSLTVGDRMPAGSWNRVYPPDATPDDDSPATTGGEADETREDAPAAAQGGNDASPADPDPESRIAAFHDIGLYHRPSASEEEQATDDDRTADDEQATGPLTARRYVAVNADASGANTAALSQQAIERWLDPLGPWQFVEADELAAAPQQAGPSVNLAWPLLWALLLLVVGETLLSRAFSHASTGGGALALVGQLGRRLLHPRGDSKGGSGA
ncbi:MAG: BatA domain-containing protein [Phycisphaeraceae bacterium]